MSLTLGDPIESGSGDSLSAVALTDDGVVVSASLDGSVQLWDQVSGSRLGDLCSREGYILDMVLRPFRPGMHSHHLDDEPLPNANPWLAHSSHRRRSSSIDIHSEALTWDLTDLQSAQDLTLDYLDDRSRHDQVLFTAGSDGRVRLWKLVPFENRSTLTTITSRQRLRQQRLASRRLLLGRCLSTCSAHQDWVRAIDAAPDGDLLASAGDDATVQLWSCAADRSLGSLGPGPSPAPLTSISLRAPLLAVVSATAMVRLYDVPRHDAPVASWCSWSAPPTAVHLHAARALLHVTCADGSLKTLCLRTQRVLDEMQVHEKRAAVQKIRADRSGTVLATCAADGSVKVWDAPLQRDGWRLRHALEPKQGVPLWDVALATTHGVAAAGADGTLHVWHGTVKPRMGQEKNSEGDGARGIRLGDEEESDVGEIPVVVQEKLKQRRETGEVRQNRSGVVKKRLKIRKIRSRRYGRRDGDVAETGDEQGESSPDGDNRDIFSSCDEDDERQHGSVLQQRVNELRGGVHSALSRRMDAMRGVLYQPTKPTVSSMLSVHIHSRRPVSAREPSSRPTVAISNQAKLANPPAHVRRPYSARFPPCSHTPLHRRRRHRRKTISPRASRSAKLKPPEPPQEEGIRSSPVFLLKQQRTGMSRSRFHQVSNEGRESSNSPEVSPEETPRTQGSEHEEEDHEDPMLKRWWEARRQMLLIGRKKQEKKGSDVWEELETIQPEMAATRPRILSVREYSSSNPFDPKALSRAMLRNRMRSNSQFIQTSRLGTIAVPRLS